MAKRTRTDPTEFRHKKVRVRVRVVEFSYNQAVISSVAIAVEKKLPRRRRREQRDE